MATNFPAKPPDIDKLDSVQPIQPGSTAPEEGKFSSLMQTKPNEVTQSSEANAPRPIDIAASAKQATSTPPTLATIEQQMQSVSGSLGDVKNQLHTRGLKLKQSEKYLLRNKLSLATDQIRSAATKTGATTTAPPDLGATKNPIERYLAMVSDGQHQLHSAINQIKTISAQGESINPADLLLVQAKLQKAQQELDFTSILLGKATEIIKTLMNVQI